MEPITFRQIFEKETGKKPLFPKGGIELEYIKWLEELCEDKLDHYDDDEEEVNG